MSEFIKAIGIFYKNELNAIKKSGVQLQPVYEAFSNAWESIEEKWITCISVCLDILNKPSFRSL